MKPVVTTTPHGSFIFGKVFDFSHRDVICLSFALGVHALLLLWKGGSLLLPDKAADGLGNTLVAVRFMNEVPAYETPGGSPPAAPRGFFERVRSMIKGEGGARPKSDTVAMGQSNRIEVAKPSWNKAETLADKAFSEKKAFSSVNEKKENLDVAMGKSNDILVKTSQNNFKTAEPNLKESSFKVATKDAPFKILKPKTDDALSNVNAIPVAVGRTTSSQVKSLDSASAAPTLQSRSFANTGGKAFSGGGAFGSSGGGKGASGGGGLSTGDSAMAAAPAGAGMGAGSGVGNDAGSGSGRGTGVGSGSGFATGNGSGKSWGGAGSGSNSLEALPRNRINDDMPATTSAATRNGAGFSITGALANRPIVAKKQPTYERDARVALRFRVDWSGHVLDGIIIELSSGSPSFDNKVLEALKEWQFSRLPSNRTNEIQEGVITFVFKGV